MGTTWSVKIISTDSIYQSEIQAQIQSILDDINSRMSNWQADSEISLLNTSSAGCMEVSQGTIEVARVSQSISEITQGAFDATVGPLVDIWGFGTSFNTEQIPDANLIQQGLDQVGYEKLRIEDNRLCKDIDDLYVNYSATAKGYGVDQVADYLESIDIDRYLVEVGGEMRVLGLNADDDPWRIGIEAPLDNFISGQVQEIVELQQGALATSGDYRNYFIYENVRYSHIIDASTGFPVPQQLASVTVLHDSAAWADGWATAMLVVGAERGLALAEQQNLAAYFVLRAEDGFEVRTSSQW